MPKICYVEKRFNESSLALIQTANEIIAEYIRQGYKLTLRQLYYQFVARDIIPNNMKSYKRLGSIINDARLAGLIDWDSVEDRVRNLQSPTTWGTTQEIIQDASSWFKHDLWENQETRVEVWVEKDALIGVIERACNKYRVPYIACRGYMSQSEAWAAGQRFIEYADNGQNTVVLHLGDHDPSGIDMSRDNRARLEMFTETDDAFFDREGVRLIRLALNGDQVRQYKPPPNPAKFTDSRAKGYIEKFGKSSWELDALEPSVIAALIDTAISGYIDDDLWAVAKAREETAKKHIRAAAGKWKEPGE